MNSYAIAETIKLSSSTFFSAYTHARLMRSDVAPIFREYLLLTYREDAHFEHRADSLLWLMQMQHMALRRTADFAGTDWTQILLDYLQALALERQGRLMEMGMVFHTPRVDSGSSMTFNDSLALFLMTLHMRGFGFGVARMDLCPVRYRNGAEEMVREVMRREQYLAEAPRQRGRETHR
jgi:hypothetical protein